MSALTLRLALARLGRCRCDPWRPCESCQRDRDTVVRGLRVMRA